MKLPIRLAAFAILSISAWATTAAPLSGDQQALHVLDRLGYGPKPGDIERVKQMGIDRYIDAQLEPETIPLPAALTQRLSMLETSNESAGEVLAEFLAVRKVANDGDEAAKQKRREVVGKIVEQNAEARLARAIDSPRQLEEVMVDFWFNHFNVFAGKGLDRALVGSYERDAIRPYVLGSFRDLLGATAKHPAMLFYLDNWLSTSADYQPPQLRRNAAQGQKAKATGLNENYARELMELHTLGVDGGYSQKDVTELARMLTGWTFEPRDLVRNNHTFRFDAQRHDMGDKEWLGHHIGAQGQGEGEFALDVLAMHPSTAHHLSYELAQYFVQDNPSPELVERLSKRYLATNGNIREVLRTLFHSPEFMASANVGAKFKTPYQFVISAARASQAPITNVRPLLGVLNQLGMPLYGAQTPDGYKNTQAAWLNPDALTRRITFATALAAGRLPLNKMPGNDDKAAGAPAVAAQPLDAVMLLNTLGPAISGKTRATIDNNPQALRAAMVLGSPDFMQR
ncbi:putative signal peptide protein [Collimonas arenae]|uniref:Putative signal peptide protein n=1 Tax=Collimonas arenae TaxID=279058 RepID=A0A0A1FCS1_9BURK|nr:DUF1800 domain-containing protein [Collimonas arenae]AIY41585.1 putative signal peptide protein [Collimonas arenae]